MKTYALVLSALLVASMLCFGGCAPPMALPTATLEASPVEEALEPPEAVIAALHAALSHISADLADQAPPSAPAWTAAFIESGDLVGAGGYEFVAGTWRATVTYPVVRPDLVVYTVLIKSPEARRQWEVKVDAEGLVIPETPAAEVSPAPEVVRAALDAALNYLLHVHGEQAPPSDLTWMATFIESEDLVGTGGYEFLAGDWKATITYPVTRPDMVVYAVVIGNDSGNFQWQGVVDASGQVNEDFAPSDSSAAVAWYGYVVSTPSGAQFDDFIVLMPEGTGEVGIEGATDDVAAEIESLRDMDEPGKYAHFWGTLSCDVIDYGGCQLLVDRLRVDGPGPFFPDDVVEAWEGVIVSGPPGPRSGGDDYLQLAGEFSLQYGIDALVNSELADQLESLRDTGVIVRVWGTLGAGVPDWNGTQIRVNQIDAVTPDQKLITTSSRPAVAWYGYVLSTPFGAQFDDYLVLMPEGSGEIGIEGATDDVAAEIEALHDMDEPGKYAHFWGTLSCEVIDYGGCQLLVDRLRVDGPGPFFADDVVEGWEGVIVNGPPGPRSGGDDYLQLAGEFSLQYGIDALANSELADQLESLRDTGTTVRVWGTLSAGVPDWNGTQIRTTRIVTVAQ